MQVIVILSLAKNLNHKILQSFFLQDDNSKKKGMLGSENYHATH